MGSASDGTGGTGSRGAGSSGTGSTSDTGGSATTGGADDASGGTAATGASTMGSASAGGAGAGDATDTGRASSGISATTTGGATAATGGSDADGLASNRGHITVLNNGHVPFTHSGNSCTSIDGASVLATTLGNLIRHFGLRSRGVNRIITNTIVGLDHSVGLAHRTALGATLGPRAPACSVSRTYNANLRTAFTSTGGVTLNVVSSTVANNMSAASSTPVTINSNLHGILVGLNTTGSGGRHLGTLVNLGPGSLVSSPRGNRPHAKLSVNSRRTVATLR